MMARTDGIDGIDGTGSDVARVDIKTLIPHREPFLMLDRLVDYQPGQALVAIKAVSRGEPWFQGHFPDLPLMPGVLMVEALAQTCAAFMRLEAGPTGKGLPSGEQNVAVLLRIQVRCLAPARPGALLTLTVRPREARAGFVDFAVNASQGERTCVRGVLTVGTTPRSRLEAA